MPIASNSRPPLRGARPMTCARKETFTTQWLAVLLFTLGVLTILVDALVLVYLSGIDVSPWLLRVILGMLTLRFPGLR